MHLLASHPICTNDFYDSIIFLAPSQHNLPLQVHQFKAVLRLQLYDKSLSVTSLTSKATYTTFPIGAETASTVDTVARFTFTTVRSFASEACEELNFVLGQRSDYFSRSPPYPQHPLQLQAVDMLPPFQIRNLRSPIQPNTLSPRNDLIRVTGQGYDQTISNHPAATLKYQDEEQDIITIGSSSELIQKLGESVPQQPHKLSRVGRDRNPMAIATMLAEEQKPAEHEYHTFHIDESQATKNVWQSIQDDKSNCIPSLVEMKKESTSGEGSYLKSSEAPTNDAPEWTSDEDALLLKLRCKGKLWSDIATRLLGRSPESCKLRYQNMEELGTFWTEEKKNALAKFYER